jgi:predicted secreted protein
MNICRHLASRLAVAALSGCVGLVAHAQGLAPTPGAVAAQALNQLTLSASASIEVPMDELSVTLAVVREAADAATVQAQMSQVLEAALGEARKHARPGELEVRTGSFSLNPRYAATRPPSSAGKGVRNCIWKAATSAPWRRWPGGWRG